MDSKMFFLFLLVVVTIPTISVSINDGFNYFKALNRTPISRVVRFYHDGLPRAFKVPLSLHKRIIYDGSMENVDDTPQKRLSSSSEDVSSLLLLHWFPSKFEFKRDDNQNSVNMKNYPLMQNSYFDEE